MTFWGKMGTLGAEIGEFG